MFEHPQMAVASIPPQLALEIPQGARVLWVGRPGRGLCLRSWDILLVPFALLWCGFVLFAFSATLSSPGGRDARSLLFLIPLLFVGLYLLVLRLLVDIWRRTRISYALTDREAIIVVAGPWSSVRRIDLARAADVQLIAGRGGSGTIWFGPRAFGYPEQNEFLGFGSPVPSFESIEDAREVYAKVLAVHDGHA
jgi:hypothetical protein